MPFCCPDMRVRSGRQRSNSKNCPASRSNYQTDGYQTEHPTFLPPFRPDTRHNLGGLEAILKHRLMSDDYQRIELITGAVRRRHWTTEQKLQIIEESFQPGETVSSVARRRGVAPTCCIVGAG